MLTKSLHTVTAVTRVALMLARRESVNSAASPELCVCDALHALGYDYDPSDPDVRDDPTIARAVDAVRAAIVAAAVESRWAARESRLASLAPRALFPSGL